MYEIRQKKIEELQQKPWFNYALLAVAMFLFTQSNSIIKTSMGTAVPLIIISFILHSRSVSHLVKKIFKIRSNSVASIAMLFVLSVISVICYFNELNLLYIVLLDFAAIAAYVIIAAIFNKLKPGEH